MKDIERVNASDVTIGRLKRLSTDVTIGLLDKDFARFKLVSTRLYDSRNGSLWQYYL